MGRSGSGMKKEGQKRRNDAQALREAPRIMVGCAGWGIPKALSARFPGEGSDLERYARVLSAVEINSSFYRSHNPDTYSHWGVGVPDGFRFAVKVFKDATHVRKLGDPSILDEFIVGTSALGERMGPWLLQSPITLEFDARSATSFFAGMRERYGGFVVCEPRHASWFTKQAERLLIRHRVGRVAADPAPERGAGKPGGWDGIVYYRLHGSPRPFYSSYAPKYLATLARRLAAASRRAPCWCIFDNTTVGAATANALDLTVLLKTE
jgi:uncharacterized protein YecE (DUF72 family)